MKKTKEEKELYEKRFEGTIPLVIYPHSHYPSKCEPDLVDSPLELRHGLYQIQDIELNKQYVIIAGFQKAKIEDFLSFDWLYGGEGLPNLFHKRLLDKMKKICPNDFIELPVTLINLSNKVEPYENKDFYIVNALNTLDAIDKEKSVFHVYPSGRQKVIKRVYKKDPWNGHLMAFDNNIKKMIFHPKLAKELYPSKQFQFLTPEEDSYWNLWREPNQGENPISRL